MGLEVVLMTIDPYVKVAEMERELFWWRLLGLSLGLSWVAFAVLWWLV